MMEPGAVAIEFIRMINNQDVKGIVSMMTGDHTFIDMEDDVTSGKEIMAAGWRKYYSWFPDYTITPSRVIQRDDIVIITGRSDGTMSDLGRRELARDGKVPEYDETQGPAIWTAEVEGDKIKVWRVARDNEYVREELSLERFD